MSQLPGLEQGLEIQRSQNQNMHPFTYCDVDRISERSGREKQRPEARTGSGN